MCGHMYMCRVTTATTENVQPQNLLILNVCVGSSGSGNTNFLKIQLRIALYI